MRLICGSSNLAIRFWIDGHNFTIVARDGIEIVPIFNVTYVTVPVGQRVDVIVPCHNMVSQKYTIYGSIAVGFIPGENP